MSRYHRSFRSSRSTAADIKLDELGDYQAAMALLPADVRVRNAQAKLYEAQLNSQDDQSRLNEIQTEFEILSQAAKADVPGAKEALSKLVGQIALKYVK